MSRRDPGLALVRALAKSCPGLSLRDIVSSDWASATSWALATSYGLEMSDDAKTRRWLDALPELEVTLAGHLLADIVVENVARDGAMLVVRIAALTLVDA